MTITFDAATLPEAFQATAAARGDQVALRTVGGTVSITWAEYAQRVRTLAAGMSALGVERDDTVCIMLTNRPEFSLVDTAALHIGAVPFSIYNTSSPEQIEYLLANSGAKFAISEKQFLANLRAGGPNLEHVVVVDGAEAGTLSLEDVEAAGSPDFDFEAEWRAAKSEDLATLIYTSGTTGPPKGVEITQANVIAQVKALEEVFGFGDGERYASYLPAAHIADRVSSHYGQMCFGTEVTMVPDPLAIAEALADCRPTFWFGVPRIWEKFRAALEAAFAEADGVKAKLLNRGLELGRRKATGENLGAFGDFQYKLLDKIVFSKIRAKLGLDEMRFAMSGASAIAPDTLVFFSALGVGVSELWGMSETTGVGTVNPPGDSRIGTVGPVLPGSEIKIAEDGELLIRGPIIMRGYRNDPERTAQDLDADGWLHTGDIATVDADGWVTIVDRKKEIIINAAGKNMSPVNIENTIAPMSPIISQVVVIGDNRRYNAGLVTLDPDVAAVEAKRLGIPDASIAELAEHPEVVAAVLRGVAEGNAKLSRVEQLKYVFIVPEVWEPGGEVLTPTLKLKRSAINERYSGSIEALFESGGAGVHEVPSSE